MNTQRCVYICKDYVETQDVRKYVSRKQSRLKETDSMIFLDEERFCARFKVQRKIISSVVVSFRR